MTLPHWAPATTASPTSEGAALDEDAGDGAAAGIQLGLDHGAGGLGVRVRPELLEVGDEDDHLEQVVEAVLGLGRDVGVDGVPSPLLGVQVVARELGADAVGVRALDVDLVDRDEDRHLGGAGVVDRLDRLRHHAVVGRDDDHGDVGDLGAAGAHGGEGLVARGVEEGDRLGVVVDLVGADVLGDPTGLTGGDLGLADRIEQRGLSVVDVAHDRDHRRAVLEVGLVVDDLLDLDLLLGRGDDLDLSLELLGDPLDLIVGERLGQGRHLAALHQGLDHLGAAEAERLGDLANRRAGGDAVRRSLFGRLLRSCRPAPRGAACGGARLGGAAAAAAAGSWRCGRGERPASR